MAGRLEDIGQEVWLQPVDGQTPPPCDIPDLTVLAFPIWSWAAPHFILDFARHLPRATGANAAVFATCGGFAGQGIGEMERLLRRLGYRVVGSGVSIYPDNWLLAVNPPEGERLKSALAEGDGQVAQFADSLLSKKPAFFRCAWIHQGWSRVVSWLFRMVGRRFQGHLFIADDACTSCGLCAKMCPVQNIQMAGSPSRPQWKASCAACYRCIQLCPVESIQISVFRLVLQLILSVASMVLGWFVASWLYGQLYSFPGLARISLAVLAAAVLLAILTIFYLTLLNPLLSWLSKRPAMRPVFLRNYTGRFGRYRAPGFRPGHPANKRIEE